MSRAAMQAAVEALSLMYANSTGTTDDEISARLRARSALSLLRAALEAREPHCRVQEIELTDAQRAMLTSTASEITGCASPVAATQGDAPMLWLAEVRDDFRRMADEANRMLNAAFLRSSLYEQGNRDA